MKKTPFAARSAQATQQQQKEALQNVIDVWNGMTEQQRAHLLETYRTSVPADCMRRLGYPV